MDSATPLDQEPDKGILESYNVIHDTSRTHRRQPAVSTSPLKGGPANLVPGVFMPGIRPSWFTHPGNRTMLGRPGEPQSLYAGAGHPSPGEVQSALSPGEDRCAPQGQSRGEFLSPGSWLVEASNTPERKTNTKEPPRARSASASGSPALPCIAEKEDPSESSEDEIDPLLLTTAKPIPVHPWVAYIQGRLREAVPRDANGDISQYALFQLGLPYALYVAFFILGVVVPRCACFDFILSGGLDEEDEMHGLKARVLMCGLLVSSIVCTAMASLRVLVWMGARVLQDVLQLEVVDERKAEKKVEMTHRNLLVGGYLG